MRAVQRWLSEIDWGPLVGALLFGLFYLGVVSPIISHTPEAHKPYAEQAYTAPEKAAIDKYIASESFWQRSFTDPVAFFTLCLTAFTALLVFVSGWQGYLILSAEAGNREALRVARENAKNLLRATRPKLSLVGMSLQEFTAGAVPDIPIKPGEVFRSVTGGIKNEGTAKAFIVDYNFVGAMGDLGPPLGNGDWQASAGGFEPIEPGGTYVPPAGIRAVPFDPNSTLLNGLYFWGWIRYQDLHQISRRAGFAFGYFSGINIFYPTGDHRYWYDIEEDAED